MVDVLKVSSPSAYLGIESRSHADSRPFLSAETMPLASSHGILVNRYCLDTWPSLPFHSTCSTASVYPKFISKTGPKIKFAI